MGFPCGSVGKESACNAGDLDSIPGLGRSPGEEKSYPLQYSGLENSMDCVIDSVAKRRMGPRDFHFTSLTFYGVVEIICRRNKQNINYVTCCGGKIWQTRDRFKGWSVLECPVKETGTCHLFFFFLQSPCIIAVITPIVLARKQASERFVFPNHSAYK